MVAPLGNRPQLGELNPSSSYGSGGSVFGEAQPPSSHTSFTAFLREEIGTDFGGLLTNEDLFAHRLARNEDTSSVQLLLESETEMDAAAESEVLATLLGNIRKSMAADPIQPVTEKPDEGIKSSVTPVVALTEAAEVPVSEAVAEAATTIREVTGYSLRQKDLAHPGDPIVTRTEAAKAAPEPKDQEPEVLTATEVRTDPKEAYEPVGKQTRERVQAVSFSGRALVKNLLNRMSKTAGMHKSSEAGLATTEQGRKLSRNQVVALGVATALGLVAASGILSNRGDGQRTLFGKSPNTTVEVEVPTGAWAEQIPTVMRWEQDVIRLIKEYDAKAMETNRINEREKRPGVVPYGAVDSGLILSLMAVASGGNQFATDKNADPNQPDKIPAGLMMISREAGRKVVTDYEPTNSQHAMIAGIAYWQVLMSMVPENDAKDRPSLVTSALQGKQASQQNTPYPVSPKLLEELVTWVPALDSEWHLDKNQHAENWLKDSTASARLQLAVNEAKDSSLASSTTATQPNKKK